jgi:hypothetical protein
MVQSFSITVANAHATLNRTLILGGGLIAEKGQIADGNFAGVEDSGDTKSLTATGSPQRIEALLNFMRNNPMLVSRLKFKSTSNEQTEVTINYKNESPFRSLGDRNISLARYTNENTVKDNVVTVTEALQFDDQTKLAIPVVADSTLTITLEVSQVLNGAEYARQMFAA